MRKNKNNSNFQLDLKSLKHPAEPEPAAEEKNPKQQIVIRTGPSRQAPRPAAVRKTAPVLEKAKPVRAKKAAPKNDVDYFPSRNFRDVLMKRNVPVEGGESAAPEISHSDAYKEGVLANGLRFLLVPIKGTKTVTALMMFGTGSKYESRSQNGLSHFLEHMFFKGTVKRRTAQKLSSELDALGSEYNAFTSREYTGYWIKADSSKMERALDILSDMLLNSRFSSAEIEREKGVIIEESNMYHENPMMYIEDLFDSCLYGDTPAGREIIGPKENIRRFKRANFLDYYETQYGANSAILCLAGDVDEKTEKLAGKFFGKMKKSSFKEKLRTPDAQKGAQIKFHYKEGNQANISLGVRAYDANHPDKIILKVLAVILGGSMSSRLFTEVRDKKGLAYYVHTAVESFSDTGYLTTQAGIPVGKHEEAVKTILAEYKKLTKQLVPELELQRTKDLIKGRTIISFEASDDVANWYGRQAVMKEKVLSPEELFAKIDAVTPADLRRVARDIFIDDKLNLAVIGPFRDEDGFRGIVHL